MAKETKINSASYGKGGTFLFAYLSYKLTGSAVAWRLLRVYVCEIAGDNGGRQVIANEQCSAACWVARPRLVDRCPRALSRLPGFLGRREEDEARHLASDIQSSVTARQRCRHVGRRWIRLLLSTRRHSSNAVLLLSQASAPRSLQIRNLVCWQFMTNE